MADECTTTKGVEYTITWTQYLKDINDLARGIFKSKAMIDAVYGIPRGGLIPATILSHKLGLPLITKEQLDTWHMRIVGRVLIVDDVSDSGETLFNLLKETRLYGSDRVLTACAYFKTNTIVKPTFAMREYDKLTWLIYPYEKRLMDKAKNVRPRKFGIKAQIEQYYLEGNTVRQIVDMGYNYHSVVGITQKQRLRDRIKKNQEQLTFDFFETAEGPLNGLKVCFDKEKEPLHREKEFLRFNEKNLKKKTL